MTRLLLVRPVVALVAGGVLAGGLGGCARDAREQDPVCAAYLRYNDAIAEAGDVSDLRAAAAQLRRAIPATATGQVAQAATQLDAALAQPDAAAPVFLAAASGVQTACDFHGQDPAEQPDG